MYWRRVQPRTRGARAIVVDDGGRVLLVRHSYEPGGWMLPGGGVRRRESPAEAVVRELREEVGVVPTVQPEVFGTYTSDAEGKRDTITLFLVTAWTRSPAASPEIADTCLVDPSDPPTDVSPATRRRLAELGGVPRDEAW